MLKHIYKAIILIAIFIASLAYFSRDIKEVVFNTDNTTKMSETSFPTVTLEMQGKTLNRLHGYAGTMESNLVRDSITPLDDSQSIFVYINENESTVKKVNYELRNTFDNTLIESGSYSALEKSGEQKVAKIKIEEELENGKEYAFTVTTVTAESKKINFYTRVVKGVSSYVKEYVEYASMIHEALLKKDTVQNVKQYFESSSFSDSTSLAYVNIKSSEEVLSYGKLKPEVVSEVVPTIKEITNDIASVELDYFVQGTTEDGTELYAVKEFMRVKYTPARMYLLNYERSMEAAFDMELFHVKESAIKLGISSEDAADLYMNADNTSLCFVRNGELWYYSATDNKAVCIFSFRQSETDYVRDVYDQHNIKVLNVDAEGNVDFMVYGYMNRGNYEGRVGIIVYRYYPQDTRIEELVYVPVSEPYQMLKENMGDFAYLSGNDVFYFMLNQNIYSYNIVSKELQILASEMTEDSYVYSKEKQYVAWEKYDKKGLGKNIVVLDLETQAKTVITPKDKRNVKLLGLIDENMIYGIAKDSNVYETINGDVVIPCYELKIVDSKLNEKKTYRKRGFYIKDIVVKDNVIHLERMKMEQNTFVSASDDQILNQLVDKKQTISITSENSKKALQEHYIMVSSKEKLDKKPEVKKAVTTIINNETVIRLNDVSLGECYYVYAYGEIEGKYQNAGEAIQVANEKVGVVVNQNQQIVWKRGTRSINTSLSVTNVFADGGKSSYDACLDMLSQFVKGNHNISTSYRSESLKKDANKIRATLVNLTGASLEEIYYYINKGRPVVAAKNMNQTVLITGYDSTSITIVDPMTKVTSKMSVSNATRLFEEAGNVFLSFVD